MLEGLALVQSGSHSATWRRTRVMHIASVQQYAGDRRPYLNSQPYSQWRAMSCRCGGDSRSETVKCCSPAASRLHVTVPLLMPWQADSTSRTRPGSATCRSPALNSGIISSQEQSGRRRTGCGTQGLPCRVRDAQKLCG